MLTKDLSMRLIQGADFFSLASRITTLPALLFFCLVMDYRISNADDQNNGSLPTEIENRIIANESGFVFIPDSRIVIKTNADAEILFFELSNRVAKYLNWHGVVVDFEFRSLDENSSEDSEIMIFYASRNGVEYVGRELGIESDLRDCNIEVRTDETQLRRTTILIIDKDKVKNGYLTSCFAASIGAFYSFSFKNSDGESQYEENQFRNYLLYLSEREKFGKLMSMSELLD